MKNKVAFGIILTAIIGMFGAASGFAQTGKSKPKLQSARIEISENGYRPDSIKLRRGVPAKLTFIRTTDATCGTEIVIPNYAINKALPLNVPVVVNFNPRRSGEFAFTCGMGMLRGKLVVR